MIKIITNQNLLKGFTLILIASLFIYQSLDYDLGTLEQPGPAMFPRFTAILLLVLGAAIMARALFLEGEALQFRFRNIGLVTLALLAFVLVSSLTNMLFGLAVLVLISSVAADGFTIFGSVKVFLFLAIVAIAMKEGLSFNLPLY